MVTDMDMAMDTATMARGRLRLPPMLSPAMDMVTDTAMVMVTAMDMAMEAMATDTTATTARGLLMLRLPLLLSPAMDMVTDTAMVMVTAMDMAMEDMAMDTTATVTDMAMATTDKFLLLF